MSVAGVAGGHHAVKHIHPARHRFHQVLGPAHAHQIAWPVLRQLRRGVLQHGIAFGFALAHRQPANGVTVKADVLQTLRRLRAQVVMHATLHDAEQRGVIAFVGPLAARSPAQRQLH